MPGVLIIIGSVGMLAQLVAIFYVLMLLPRLARAIQSIAENYGMSLPAGEGHNDLRM